MIERLFIMKLEVMAKASLSRLETRGLKFSTYLFDNDMSSFVYPRNWLVDWKDDYAIIHHGDPASGWMVVYPVIFTDVLTVSVAELTHSFIDEFLEPAVANLSIINSDNVDGTSFLYSAECSFTYKEKECRALLLSWSGLGQGRIVAYWTHKELYNKELIYDLLLTTIASFKASFDSKYCEVSVLVEPVDEKDIWQPNNDIQLETSFAVPKCRFALRLPPSWNLEEVYYEGESGWLLIPQGGYSSEYPAIISITSSDITSKPDLMLKQAIDRLNHKHIYSIEHGEKNISTDKSNIIVQMWLGTPFDESKHICRLWSAGVFNDETIVHIFAITRASVLMDWMPTLSNIVNSIRLLPRQLNIEMMAKIEGLWRFFDNIDEDGFLIERIFHFKENCNLSFIERKVAKNDNSLYNLDLDSIKEKLVDGKWEVVDQTLVISIPNLDRMSYEIEHISERSGVMGKIFWEKVLIDV